MIDGKKLAEAGFRYLGVPYARMDCQAFVEQCLRDCELEKNLAGSNAWYREVMKNGVVMTPEECVRELGKVPAGAFLFILQQDGGEPAKYKPDGLGNASHIGICTGRGEGAIHSSASRGCVAESKFKGKSISGGWNRVGLWNEVSYDYGDGKGSSADPAAVPDATLEPAQQPVALLAHVWSENGKPVNTRKGPGANYPLSRAGKLPVGTQAEILERKGDWCRIRCRDLRGAAWVCWMKSEFLKGENPVPGKQTSGWTVTIPDLTEPEARLLAETYPGAIISGGEIL